jgi:hypothetical protein
MYLYSMILQRIRSCLPTLRFLVGLLGTSGVLLRDIGDFLGVSGYETWTQFILVFGFFGGLGVSTL